MATDTDNPQLPIIDEHRNNYGTISLRVAAALVGTNPKNYLSCLKAYGRSQIMGEGKTRLYVLAP